MSKKVFLEILNSLNRKERFHLLKMATKFELDQVFLEEVCGELDLKIPKTSGCFLAFDYHIDWLAAAVQLMEGSPAPSSQTWDSNIGKGTVSKQFPNEKFADDKRMITGTQEDIDCLVAFEIDDDRIAIILVEAKGDTGWKRAQLESKLPRLNEIFKQDWIDARFLMTSPKTPGRSVGVAWEGFSSLGIDKGSRIPHVKLTRGNCGDDSFLLKVTRTDNSENGYKHWKFDRRGWG